MSESEARRGVEDAGDKIKAGAKAIGKKTEDPNRDRNRIREGKVQRENSA